MITVAGLPSAVTVQPVTAAVGSTANLTFVSTTALAAECFQGVASVFSSYSSLALQAKGSSGTETQGYGMEVVLENPSFTPTKTYLPVVNIATDGGIAVTSEDDYVDGTLTITDPMTSSNNYTGTMEIKGHGNTTWAMPKKPYKVKLDSKAKLMGMHSEKNWVLLANYDDKTMLRDAVASYISNMTRLPWAPASYFVEMTMNGQYMGVYQLIESVDIDSNRVDIADSDASTDPTQDGYLMEIDHTLGDTFNWTTPHGLPVGSHDPDPPTDAQEAYIQPLVNNAEATFFASNASDATAGWRSKWTEASVVDWFLVNELMGNHDANGESEYFYKDVGDVPFVAGPIWDFDISSGNDDYGAIQDPSVAWVSTQHAWYAALFKNDPTFQAAVKTEWAAMRSQVSGLPDYIDTSSATLAQAANNNYQRWPNLYQRVWPNPEAAGSYSGEVTYLKQWINSRISYMDKTYGN
ncbi:CotH kinase family protein [Terriglobus sp. TAA 43]|uniref:CotH kinase family protein n=1 Tax=Terriglobus sp. TAA 43 TaxID=278961 RepID=UPI000647E66D|nr:CotH kinase family protein [Terriglobus sp. TAA 43]